MKYRLPAEVGLARFVPPPPTPRQTKAKAATRRYVIFSKDLLQMGYTPKEINQLKARAT